MNVKFTKDHVGYVENDVAKFLPEDGKALVEKGVAVEVKTDKPVEVAPVQSEKEIVETPVVAEVEESPEPVVEIEDLV